MTPRIHVEGATIAIGEALALPPAASRHVARALRMRAGDSLTLFDGAGGEYEATLARIDRDGAIVRILAHREIDREARFQTTLVLSLIASDMMDFAVRKAVELGVAAIVPVLAARSQNLAPSRALARASHWRQIAIAACEQCGRNRVPSIAPLVPLIEWLSQHRADGKTVILDADAETSLATIVRDAVPAFVLIGPEGGFTPDEVAVANRMGAHSAHLGPRILRAETAAIAALATIEATAA
jgi:16S rRNA (uracil1498-N3)-methyltransferase